MRLIQKERCIGNIDRVYKDDGTEHGNYYLGFREYGVGIIQLPKDQEKIQTTIRSCGSAV